MTVKTLLVVGGIAGAAGGVVAMRLRAGGDPKEAMAHRMREHIESMPAEFPPRMMLDNLAATRANTEEILRILGEERSPAAGTADDPVATGP